MKLPEWSRGNLLAGVLAIISSEGFASESLEQGYVTACEGSAATEQTCTEFFEKVAKSIGPEQMSELKDSCDELLADASLRHWVSLDPLCQKQKSTL